MEKHPFHRRHYLIGLLLVLCTFAVYWRVLTCGFVFDDQQYIVDSPYIRSGISWSSVAWAFTSTYAYNWHPLTWISHLADVSLFGMRPAGHHAVNLVLHVLNVLLLFFVLIRLTYNPNSEIRNPKWARCAFVAALFAIHPLHVESVAWVAERKDVLSTFFFLLTILAYIRYVQHPGLRTYAPVVLAFGLGLMAKPMLVTLPFVLLLLDYWPLGRFGVSREPRPPDSHQPSRGANTQHPTPDTDPSLCPPCLCGSFSGSSTSKSASRSERILLEKVPLLVLAAGSCVLTFVAQAQGGAVVSAERFTFSIRVSNALVAYVSYILKMLWPKGLAVYYPHAMGSIPVWQVALSALALLGITLLTFVTSRRKPYLIVGWLWYVGTLVPVIGLVQVGGQAMADRYTYVPLIGLFVMVAWGVPELLKGRKGEREKGRKGEEKTRGHGDAANVQVPTTETRNPTPVTREPTPASAEAPADKPNTQHLTPPSYTPILPYSYTLHLLLALAVIAILSATTWSQLGYWKDNFALFDHAIKVTRGNYIAHSNLGVLLEQQGKPELAMQHYRRAIQIKPSYAEAHVNLGNVLFTQGKTDEAVREYGLALKANRNQVQALFNLGSIAEHHGLLDDAADLYGRAIEAQPEFAAAHDRLGVVYLQQGLAAEAMGEFQEAVRYDPQSAEAHINLGRALSGAGRIDEAQQHFTEAVKLDPKNLDAHLALGATLVDRGMVDEGMAHYMKALKIKPDSPHVHNNLAVAYYYLGRYDDAWKEVDLCLDYLGSPSPDFLRALSQKKPPR